MPVVPDTEEYRQRCICGECPSFPGDDGFYCAVGKSSNEVERRGCSCADCENYREFGLQGEYYCEHGAAGTTQA